MKISVTKEEHYKSIQKNQEEIDQKNKEIHSLNQTIADNKISTEHRIAEEQRKHQSLKLEMIENVTKAQAESNSLRKTMETMGVEN